MKKIVIKRNVVITLLIIFAFLVATLVGCVVYISDYYRANDREIEAFSPKTTTEVYEKRHIAFGSPDASIGFVFYPGGKVEYTAYIPMMRAISAEGVFCVLAEMPFNLAVFDIDAADEICEKYPNVEKWYVGGHSLGGSMAAAHISGNTDKFAGLVLLGSYSTADLSFSELSALSIYGSEDGVMNREKYEENKVNLPKDFTEIIIDGGCHAYFGMYGEQDGDGVAFISPEEQIMITSEHITNFLCGKDG